MTRSTRTATRRLHPAWAGSAVFALTALIVGCAAAGTTGDSEAGSATSGAPSTLTTTMKSTHTSVTTMISTVTASASTRTVTAEPPPSTAEPAAVAGDCPYLSTDVVAELTGQRQGQPTIIDVKPFPVCEFHRSDGDWAATVRIIEAPTPESATAAVNQHVPVGDSQPASQPPGWVGGVMSEGEQTADAEGKSTYAVSKGKFAVVSEENESRSIKARSIAICAIYGTKLETGPAPDYCGSGS
ncbi:DUF2020 domain-containing protein [Nakamurella sp. YIM 132087]|uniref:DUF2020 domain-containing protein n=1 Tax=Nakamurella alba TaxID=2665158 RepID=A0A7K1FKS8_9ACTN|nr:DUF2020 domain-containing protein [Nakamurella alba]MTD14752.1 DUF2020 domain-containing protein [Nakamurella alba]